MNPLALLVEGPGDAAALPNLVSRVVLDLPPELQPVFYLDGQPVVVGELPKLSGRHTKTWLDRLRLVTQGQRHARAVLTVLDADTDRFEGAPLCVRDAARTLADRARAAGAGTMFSLAVVLLKQEYESLLIAAADQLPELSPDAVRPTAPEDAPRDAKGWLDQHLPGGYGPVTDQLRLTQSVTDFQPVRDRMRCFKRLENAVLELATAVASGQHVCTPCVPPAA